jgi:hypothetical protein
MLANYGITLYLYSYSDKAADQNSARAADLAYEQRLLAENRSALLSSLNKEVPGLDLRHAALVLFIKLYDRLQVIFMVHISQTHFGKRCVHRWCWHQRQIASVADPGCLSRIRLILSRTPGLTR